MLPHNLLEVFIAPLEQAEIPYFVTGSVASIFYGEPRLTHDVDIVVYLNKDFLRNELEKRGLVSIWDQIRKA